MMLGQLEHILPVVQAFGIALDYLSRMLVGCASKYFKVLEKHFVIWKVLKYQYKYLTYSSLCLSTSTKVLCPIPALGDWVVAIVDRIPSERWDYVITEYNPGDCVSRG